MIAHQRYQYFTHTWLKLGCDQLLYFKRVEKKVLRRHQMKLSKGGLFFYEVTSKLSRLSSKEDCSASEPVLGATCPLLLEVNLAMKIQSCDLSSLLGNTPPIRCFPPRLPMANLSPSTHTQGRPLWSPRNQLALPSNYTWHPAARVSQLEPLRPVDARCWKMRLYGCISVWLTLLWDAQGGKTCPQIDSKKGSSAHCLGQC